jgi:hypothetical protein
MLFEVFDDIYWGKDEKIILRNMAKFRDIIRSIIHSRKEDMEKDINFSAKNSDFVTLLLNDDFFKTDEDMIVDECVTFMIAAT